MVADVEPSSAPRFMSLDAVRAGMPTGNSLRPVRQGRVTNDPTTPTPTLVGVGVAKPGFMPIKRDAMVPAPSRGMPMMAAPIRAPLPTVAEVKPSNPLPAAAMPQKLSKSTAAPLLDLFGGRSATTSTNFYDALRSQNTTR